MISGYDKTFNWGGSVTVPRKSRVYKCIPSGFVAEYWVSRHPVLGAQVFDTWRDAMDHANSRTVNFLWAGPRNFPEVQDAYCSASGGG